MTKEELENVLNSVITKIDNLTECVGALQAKQDEVIVDNVLGEDVKEEPKEVSPEDFSSLFD